MTDDRRVAFVTGSQSGIGAALASRLESENWRVARFDRAADHDPGMWSFAGSTTDDSQLREAITCLHDDAGRMDTVICSAGHNEHRPFTSLTKTDWDSMFEVHLRAAAVVIDAALPLVGGKKKAVVAVGRSILVIV